MPAGTAPHRVETDVYRPAAKATGGFVPWTVERCMAGTGYRSPSFLSMAGGIAIGVLLIISLCLLGDVVKSAGAALLWVPAQLGFVQQVRPADVAVFQMESSPNVIAFSEPGEYQVYTSDLEILEVSAQLQGSPVGGWLTIVSRQGGESIPAEPVVRGTRTYDTPFARGRPVMRFRIVDPGEYVLIHSTRASQFSIVPDYTTGNESRLGMILALEVALIVGGGFLLLRGLRRRSRRRRRS